MFNNNKFKLNKIMFSNNFKPTDTVSFSNNIIIYILQFISNNLK